MLNRPLTRRALVTALAALALVLTAAANAAAPAHAPKQQKGAFSAASDARSVDHAVATGRVDGAVVETLRANGSVRALVTFADTAAPGHVPRDELAAVVADLRGEYAQQERHAINAADGDADVIRAYPNLPVSFVRFDSEQGLLDVVNAEGVTGIRENIRGEAATLQSLSLIRQPTAAAQGRIGTGSVIAILDTGIQYYRPAFGSCSAPGGACRVALTYEFGDRDGYQDDGVDRYGQPSPHGTNVAGIVAGVAPGAKLISVDVFTNGSYWTGAAIVSAIDQLVALKAAGWNIRAANLSLGEQPTYYESPCSTYALAPAFQKARSYGILPVVSSGNDAYSNGVYRRGVSAPSCVPGALSVGAVTDGPNAGGNGCVAASGADQPTYFSQSGNLLSLLAPGSCIEAAGIRMQGTSQAAPHVSGAVAVLAAARPSATIDQIAYALVNSGPGITDTRFNVTRRRLDLAAALATLLGGADTTAPVVRAPVQSLPLSWSLGTAVVPVTLTWSATDSSGVSQYDVIFRRDGGTWTRLTLPNPASPNVTVNDLVPGSSYQFGVAARDGAGNWSGYAYGPAFVVDAYQENSLSVRYTGTWNRLQWASAFGGFQAASSVAGSQASLTFTGRDVAWVAPRSTIGGRAYVYVDGVFVRTIDLYATATTARQIVFSRAFGAVGTHTLTVRVEGTAGRPQVDVDAFVVLR